MNPFKMNSSKIFTKKHSITYSLLLIFSLLLFFSYTSLQHFINTHQEESLNSLQTIEEVIIEIYKEESILYRTLLIDNSKELEYFNTQLYSTNSSTTLTSSILELFSQIQEQSQEDFQMQSTMYIEDLFSIQKLRTQIIETHKLQLISTQENYEEEINQLLKEYEELITRAMFNLNNNINDIKANNKTFENELHQRLLITFIIIFIYVIVSVIILNKTTTITSTTISSTSTPHITPSHITPSHIEFLESDIKEILHYIKSQINLGNFPTIKNIKLHFNLTHPTITSKLKILEEKKLITYKRKGRNKYIILNS